MSTSAYVDFGGLRIEHDERVLEPRPWTAEQSRWAADLISTAPPGPVLELCAGAGHIGLLAVSLAPRSLVCVDANEVACDFVLRNAAAAGLRVDVRHGLMSQVLEPDERFAVVIADPPWVPTAQIGTFPEDPRLAIDGGADGLTLVRECLDVIERHLVVAGSAVLQVGPGAQAEETLALIDERPTLQLVASRGFDRGTLLHLDKLARPAQP